MPTLSFDINRLVQGQVNMAVGRTDGPSSNFFFSVIRPGVVKENIFSY